MSFPTGFRFSWVSGLLLLATGLLVSACAKEKVACGRGTTTYTLLFKVVDDRNGRDYFNSLSPAGLDSLQRLNPASYPRRVGGEILWRMSLDSGAYDLPTAGGDLTRTHLLRLSPTDTDTLVANVRFGRLLTTCSPYHEMQGVELRYNGRLSGRYGFGGVWNGADFTCNYCETVLEMRKRR